MTTVIYIRAVRPNRSIGFWQNLSNFLGLFGWPRSPLVTGLNAAERFVLQWRGRPRSGDFTWLAEATRKRRRREL